MLKLTVVKLIYKDILENVLGYKWYSYARPKYRDDGSLSGGGGTAILVNARNWLSEPLLNIIVPQGLEVVWVKVAPRNPSIYQADFRLILKIYLVGLSNPVSV